MAIDSIRANSNESGYSLYSDKKTKLEFDHQQEIKNLDQQLRKKIEEKQDFNEKKLQLYEEESAAMAQKAEEQLHQKAIQLSEQKEALEKQREFLLKQHTESLDQLRKHQVTEAKHIHDEQERRRFDLQSKLDQESQTIKRRTQERLSQEFLENKHVLDEQHQHNDDEKRLQQKNHEISMENRAQKQQSYLDFLEKDLKDKEQVIQKTYEYQKLRISEENEKSLQSYSEQNHALKEKLTQDYRNQSVKMQENHDQKLLHQTQRLNKELSDGAQKGQKQIDEIFYQNALRLAETSQKQKDPFYRLQSFDPKIIDLGPDYEVSIKIPDYEQENIHVVYQNGLLTFTGTRRFEIHSSSPKGDGAELKTNNYQSYSESIPLLKKVDLKKMTRNYEKGILTFRLPKS